LQKLTINQSLILIAKGRNCRRKCIFLFSKFSSYWAI